MSDPLACIGIVTTSDQDLSRPGEVLGSGFLFRSDHVAVTAAHCVPSEIDRVDVLVPRRVSGVSAPNDGKLRVTQIERHPTADVALLFDEGFEGLVPRPDLAPIDAVGNIGLGEEFASYGYFVEGPAIGTVGSAGPAPRFFKGYYQRYMQYESAGGYRYLACELSIPMPAGMSGSPLLRPMAGGSWLPTGIVTGSMETYTMVDSIEEVDDDGRVFRAESRKVITYGVGLVLYDVVEWLNDLFPPRANEHGHGWLLRRP